MLAEAFIRAIAVLVRSLMLPTLVEILWLAFEIDTDYSSSCNSYSCKSLNAILSCADGSFSSADF